MLLAFRQSFSTSFLYRTVRIGGGSTRKFSEIPPWHSPREQLSCAAADQVKEKEDRNWDSNKPQKKPTQLPALSGALAEILHARESRARVPSRVSKKPINAEPENHCIVREMSGRKTFRD